MIFESAIERYITLAYPLALLSFETLQLPRLTDYEPSI